MATIKHINGTILYQDDGATIRETLEAAVKEGADLSGANLSGVDLYCANLYCANLYCANLYCANLSGANLSGADLYCANLYCANLSGADLFGAMGVNFNSPEFQRTRILPEGSVIGWKKCANGTIVKLRIPEEANRSQAFGRKCRAEYADVLAIFDRDGTPCDSARSVHDGGATVYKAGTRVYPDGFSDNWQEECAPGIHFFITRAEAEDY